MQEVFRIDEHSEIMSNYETNIVDGAGVANTWTKRGWTAVAKLVNKKKY